MSTLTKRLCCNLLIYGSLAVEIWGCCCIQAGPSASLCWLAHKRICYADGGTQGLQLVCLVKEGCPRNP